MCVRKYLLFFGSHKMGKEALQLPVTCTLLTFLYIYNIARSPCIVVGLATLSLQFDALSRFFHSTVTCFLLFFYTINSLLRTLSTTSIYFSFEQQFALAPQTKICISTVKTLDFS